MWSVIGTFLREKQVLKQRRLETTKSFLILSARIIRHPHMKGKAGLSKTLQEFDS
jgi:hypothetical protein